MHTPREREKMYRGTIIDAFKKEVWYAVIEPRSRKVRNRRVIAPLSKGGDVGFSEDGTGTPWIFKGTMDCVPTNGVEVLYNFHYDTDGFDRATLWCTVSAWQEAEDMVRDLLFRLSLRDTADLMMPEGLCPSGICGSVEVSDEDSYIDSMYEIGEFHEGIRSLTIRDHRPGELPRFVETFTAVPAL